MSNYIIEYSKDAKQDLVDIKKYIKYNLNEPHAADKLIRKVKNEIDNLISNPEIYSIIDDDIIKRLELRKIIVGNYIVFYRILKTKIQIVRIMYGRRNWITLL